MKTAAEIQADAITIEGLLDGLDTLWDNPEKGARNAMVPIMDTAKAALTHLVTDLEALDNPDPKITLMSGADGMATAGPAVGASFFDPNAPVDPLRIMYRILGLAEFGVCSTDNTWGHDLKDNYNLYEQIGLLAAQAINAAERAERVSKTAA